MIGGNYYMPHVSMAVIRHEKTALSISKNAAVGQPSVRTP